MQRSLNDGEIRELLEKQPYGHLACHTEDGRLYLVPMTYAFHDRALYCFSFQGEKIKALRKRPEVCFQVERLSEPTHWRSAILWGDFEELSGADREDALALIIDRLWQETTQDHPVFLPFRNSLRSLEAAKLNEGVVLYRIRIKEQTGRLEEYEA